jgi:transcriptional regulator with XRE-family HTH domain
VVYLTIGEKIKNARKECKMTQKQLAEKSGLIETTIRKYEAGTQNPKLNNLQKMAAALDMPLSELISPEEPDREHELICDTLHEAGYIVDQAVMADEYYIAPLEAPDDPETMRKIEYSRLAETVLKILKDAEEKKKEYIKKRVEAELFGWL